MPPMLSVSRSECIATIMALIFALLVRAWLSIKLVSDGMSAATANDLAYLVVPPILMMLLWPILLRQRAILRLQFRRCAVNVRIVATAIAVGLLLRLFAWCQLILGVSIGWISNSDANAIIGPSFSFQCQPLSLVILGFLVMAVLVPFVEEISHRAIVIAYLKHYGVGVSIVLSALIFMLLHTMSTWSFVLIAGFVFAIQYWVTGSLWSSVISHATVNAIIQIDWRCLNGQWNPAQDTLPLWLPALSAASIGLLSLLSIAALIDVKALGQPNPPEGLES